MDVLLTPYTEQQETVAPPTSQRIWGTLQNQPWAWGLTRGAAMATLLGGLLLRSPVSTALAAPSQDQPPPPLQRAADDGALDRLVKRIGDDSPLWQLVEPGDGSPLWRLVERVGPDSELWRRLEQSGPDSPLWKRIERMGADNPAWDRLGQGGDDGQLDRLVERIGGAGPTWKAVGAGRSSGPTFTELGEESRPISPLAVQAGHPAHFVERCGYDNPLYAYSGSFGSIYNLTSGGYYVGGPAPAFVDIDGDGDFDAFVGENYGKGYCYLTYGYSQDDVRFFENLHYDAYYGDYGSPSFVERCDGYANPLPLRTGGNFTATFPTPTFVDIDGDGDFDAFVGEQYGYSACGPGSSQHDVRFFENIGNASNPVFTETCGITNPLPLRVGGTFTASFPTPTFVDIDGDGDFDAFVGELYGYSPTCGPSANDVRFFRHYSIENYGVASTPVFTEQCGPNNPLGAYSGYFGGGYYYSYYGGYYFDGGPAPTFVDIDGDGDFDAFVGESGYGYSPRCGHSGFGIRFFENTGDAYNPSFVERCGGANPLYSGSYYSGYYYGGYFYGLGAFLRPMPDLVDIDGDGDFDAFVGELFGIGACGNTLFDVRFFENAPLPVGGLTEPVEPSALLQPLCPEPVEGLAALAGVGVAGAVAAAIRKLKKRIA